MKFGITGARGFIAWHLRCYLHSLGEQVTELRLADRDTFEDADALQAFVDGLDCIAHMAGVNRAPDADLMEGNTLPALQLVEALKSTGSSAAVLYSSTTYAVNPSSVYGEAKKVATDIFQSWAAESGNRFINLVIPHVYGEYGKPFYNSGVATFCYQLTHGDTPQLNPEGQLELVHVQDLAAKMVELLRLDFSGDYRVEGRVIAVPGVVDKLRGFIDTYLERQQLPDLTDPFDRRLFNTLRSYIDYDGRNRLTVLHSDNRGWLVETVKAGSGGQCFVSSTHPGITRGNHYHRYKVERFFVIKGKAQIKLRKLFTGNVVCYDVDGSSPGYIDIPTLHTHSITNVGSSELITLFWTDEYYDPDNTDTFFEQVE